MPMKETVQKFTFDVIAPTLEECVAKLDSIQLEIMTNEGGEPWVVAADEYQKQALDLQRLLAGDPDAGIYHGSRTVVFTGPTPLGGETRFHDGHRPQKGAQENS